MPGIFRARVSNELQRIRTARSGNANGGTDHGDLKFNTDFRSVYGTVLDKWLKAPSQTVLGRKFPALEIV
jgi:uncharacterized protein (DUF1501 family)